MCIDRVRLGVELRTALTAVSNVGSPAGRDQNASLVKAFFSYDKHRAYSSLKSVEPYRGQYLISRDIKVPTSATFVVVEYGKQVPIVLCGWKNFRLEKDQVRAWLTMLDSGLFSISDYRHSPWEVLLFPDQPGDDGFERQPLLIREGDYKLFSQAEMRDLASMFARAQRAAMPIARELWEAKEARRRDKLRREGLLPADLGDSDMLPDLFAKVD